MTALTVLPGGGECSDVLNICTLCGTPHHAAPCRILERHLDWMRMRGLSQATIKARRGALRLLGEALPVPVLDATPADLYTWRSALKFAERTVCGYVSAARQFYTWAAGEGLRESNPALRLPVPRPPRCLPRPIGEADLMAALEQAPPRVRLWLVLAAWAGLRAKEIALLRRENILDAATPPVLIIATNATKGRRERAIPLSAFVLAELAAARLPARGYVFARHDGQRGPNGPHVVSHVASQHLRECGIAATLHQLRHRFGTTAYRAARRDLRVVQELMGHQDPATTAGYAAYDREAAAAAVEALPSPSAARKIRAAGPGPVVTNRVSVTTLDPVHEAVRAAYRASLVSGRTLGERALADRYGVTRWRARQEIAAVKMASGLNR